MVDRPPGFRFYPTEEELICFYLCNKLDNRREDMERVIPVVDVYSVDPRQLSDIHQLLCGSREGEPWFYFCRQQEQVARGRRPTRMTPSGYWKAAGTPGLVYSAERRPIGMKKTMVFYHGRAPTGTKTKWKMNEYKAFQYAPAPAPAAAGCLSSAHATAAPNTPLQLRSEFSLCRLYTKSGCLRQFDRRPAGVGEGAGDNPGPSTAAASADDERGMKRKKRGSNNGSSSDDDNGSRGCMQQQAQQEDTGDPHWDDGETALADLFYWPSD